MLTTETAAVHSFEAQDVNRCGTGSSTAKSDSDQTNGKDFILFDA
jgi:hypothetical protein